MSVAIENLTVSYQRRPAVHHLDMVFGAGEMWAVFGPNGAGKSTLLSLMARLQPLTHGRIRYDGRDLAATPTAEMARKLAILTQEGSVQSRISVRDLLMFGRFPYHQGHPQALDREIVAAALHEFGLEPLAERYLTELSGGQRQRAMIAMVFCQQTDYVLLDEPLNNLDMFYAKSLMQLLQRLTHEHKRTTVVVLHDINQAAAYADHIIAMQHGQVAFAGAPDDVFTEANIKTLFNMDAAVIDYAGKKLVVHHV